MPGRRPTPTHLKVVQGNPGRRAMNPNEPRPPRKMPAVPKGLSRRARAAWDHLGAMLFKMGVLTEVDGAALERLADCYAEVVELRAKVRRHGHTYKVRTKAGGVMVRARPEVAMLADADRRFKSYLVEFGLTPAARSKVQADGPEEEGGAGKYFR